jgi:hypothetical protein
MKEEHTFTAEYAVANSRRNQWKRIAELAQQGADGDKEEYCIRWIRRHLTMLEAGLDDAA